MAYTILLYGATGYSGGQIAAEAAVKMAADGGSPGRHRMILAGRDGRALERMASAYAMEYRVFGLDHRAHVERGLADVDVVINAAGPFALTAERLATVALEVGCHYADINGEIDVYRKLDDFERAADQRGVAMVSAAGYSASVSDLLLEQALGQLVHDRIVAEGDDLGAVRIAMSWVPTLTRGSAATVWRSLREQVTVVRKAVKAKGRAEGAMVLWHEPVGRLERLVDFGARIDRRIERQGHPAARPAAPAGAHRGLRIASAADCVDTMTARRTVWRRKLSARTIESYVEAGTATRIGYQAAALMAPVAAIPWLRELATAQLAPLPEGPSEEELERQRQVVVLEIDDRTGSRLIDWRMETPNVYRFTARVALAVAVQLVGGARRGWLTPAEVLAPLDRELATPGGALADCRLERRSG